VSGKVEFNYGFKRMTNPHIEVLDAQGAAGGEVHGLIIPIHGACAEITPALMRRLIANALDEVAGVYDPLPRDLRARYKLMSRSNAYRCIHFPQSMAEAAQAKRRLIYEELLLLQLFFVAEGAKRAQGMAAFAHTVGGPHMRAFKAALPFEFTSDQAAAEADILRQMAAPQVANHMVLGDVGTGKTAVAASALAACADSGSQAFLLAPTEVLARQHARTLAGLFEGAGITCDLLTGSTDAPARQQILARFAAGDTTVLIGTHALFEDDVRAQNLTLVVIDEQQRFGVDQRARLLSKGAACAPDALYLTATPIPRSLALAIFGNLTLSYIKQKPNAAAARQTRVLEKRNQGVAYDAARAQLDAGHQVYVVCPLIGVDSDARNDASVGYTYDDTYEDDGQYFPAVAIEGGPGEVFENLSDVKNEAKYLATKIFPDSEVGVLHGSMKPQEKNEVMQRFAAGEIGVLVSTTVIEVGVDVPNATVMIIEDADRFGLSQLHQLRGRVGRGDAPAQVFLISASKQEPALARLRALEQTDDGFEIANFDLGLRREGDILGNRQSGTSALKLVNVVRDAKIIEVANADAKQILHDDPNLKSGPNAALSREMRQTFDPQRINYAVIGG
jgi:ATP-dependent DNA helicase RecG